MPTLTSNSIQTSKPGLKFTANTQTWTIAAGVQASSSGNDGVLSHFGGSRLVNHGHVLASGSGFDGVAFDGDSGHITNAANGKIDGHASGIHLTGSGATIGNAGVIIGRHADGIFFDQTSNQLTFNNSGTVSGLSNGVLDGSTDGAHIDNSGTIKGGVVGIEVITQGDATTVIHNGADGVIQGATADGASVFALFGAVSLDNEGKLVGKILFAADNPEEDTVVNSGSIAGTVSLGGGNDSFNGTGGTSGAIFGGGGNDHLVGGKSADHIHGGVGNDQLSGGPGADHFVFDTALSESTNVDDVAGFVHGTDKIDLKHTVFTAAGAIGPLAAQAFHKGSAAHDTSDRIIYNPTNGFLSYDSDGSTSHGATAIHFATLAPNLALTNADFAIVA